MNEYSFSENSGSEFLGESGRWFRGNGTIVVSPGVAEPLNRETSVFSRWKAPRVSRSRVLTYTTKDVIDNRISIPAQHSLVRLSKNPRTNAAAVGLLNDVKKRRLGGISCVNWQKAAQRAQKLGKSWWTVIPPGEDAMVLLDPANPLAGQPLIVFRRELDPDCGLLKGEKRFAAKPARLDAALLKVWSSLRRMRRSKPRLCPVRRPGPIEAEQVPAFTCIANIIPPILGQIVPPRPALRLSDITADKTKYVDSGGQDGKALAAPETHHAFCDDAGGAALPLIPVLSNDENACGIDRFRIARVAIPKKLRGTLVVFSANTTDAAANPPGLFMVWIPDNLDQKKAERVIDFHVALHAQPTGTNVSYPLGIETEANGKQSQPYITKGYFQVMWRTWAHFQHDMVQRDCVYVAPIAPDNEMFSKLTAATLAKWLQEVAVLVKARVLPPGSSASNVRIGRVALSGFSRGGQWVSIVLANAGDAAGTNFLSNNVKEVYFFDVAGDSPEAVRNWQANSINSILRVYDSRLSKYQVYKSMIETGKGQERVRIYKSAPAGQARETNSAKGSVVFVPSSLLRKATGCGTRNFGCAVPFSQDAHAWYVNFFMAHALNSSDFARL